MVDYLKRSNELEITKSKKELSDLLIEIENKTNESVLKSLLEKKNILQEEISFLENIN